MRKVLLNEMSTLERCDDCHVGHFLFNYMRTEPDEIFQIDAGTGQQETRRSALSRSIRLARSLRRFGLVPGDVLVLSGRNHLDGHIPYNAAMFNGLPMAGIDPQFKYSEIKLLFEIVKPKIAFCEFVMLEDYERVVRDLNLDTKLVTFGGGECTMDHFMETYHDSEPEEEFKVATFDTDKIYCWLQSTSGTSGIPKVVALRHSNILQNLGFFYFDKQKDGVRRPGLQMASMQWISGCFLTLLLPLHHIKLQTSVPATTEHVIDIINKYKPVVTVTSPTLLAPILRHQKPCDLTCFDVIRTGGSKVYKQLLNELKTRLRKDAIICQGYGQTENGGIILELAPDGPLGNLGRPRPEYQLKIVDPSSGKVINEPNVTGELWTKGPCMACYYNDPKATAEAFSEDGYYKTGDLLYRDENDYYFYVDRMKMLLKYKNFQVVPPEVEEVILSLEGVEAACVTGVPHAQDGEHVAACVVRRPGACVTAQDVKDHVASHLSAPKQLHGGVVFVERLPLTATGKVARNQVQELVVKALGVEAPLE